HVEQLFRVEGLPRHRSVFAGSAVLDIGFKLLLESIVHLLDQRLDVQQERPCERLANQPAKSGPLAERPRGRIGFAQGQQEVAARHVELLSPPFDAVLRQDSELILRDPDPVERSEGRHVIWPILRQSIGEEVGVFQRFRTVAVEAKVVEQLADPENLFNAPSDFLFQASFGVLVAGFTDELLICLQSESLPEPGDLEGSPPAEDSIAYPSYVVKEIIDILHSFDIII